MTFFVELTLRFTEESQNDVQQILRGPVYSL